MPVVLRRLVFWALAATALATIAARADPPALNPFGPKAATRDDALPGVVVLSDGTLHPGRLYLTRDARLSILDDAEKRRRDVPLSAVTRIECAVAKEWLEKEWRFRENANDARVYTGRSYPAREYVHTITLNDGRTIKGAMSGIVYVQPADRNEPERFLLHIRDKGEAGTDLKALTYVKSVHLGEQAAEEAAKRQPAKKARRR